MLTVNKEELLTKVQELVDALSKADLSADAHVFVQSVFQFWSTLREGWIRHGIAEIIKMACVKDLSLFELIEKAGTRLI